MENLTNRIGLVLLQHSEQITSFGIIITRVSNTKTLSRLANCKSEIYKDVNPSAYWQKMIIVE